LELGTFCQEVSLNMLLLFLSIALTNTQQTRHDANEWKMYQQIRREESVIADMWRPPAKLAADYRKARNCYVKYHLYRAASCSAELNKVEMDLGQEEVARTESR
jgi:hypothetical protein